MPTKAERAADLAVFLAEANEGVTRADAGDALTRLYFYGRKLHRIYERQCNGHQTWDGQWDEAAANRDEAAEEKALAAARKLAAHFGLTLYVNSDPRGNPLGLHTPKTGKYNTLGGAEAGWRF